MEKENFIDSFKSLLAEAMLVGSQSADVAYKGEIKNPENQEMTQGLKKLYYQVENFLAANPVPGVTAEDVFPLYSEIQELTEEHTH